MIDKDFLNEVFKELNHTGNYVDIFTTNLTLCIEKRPPYCDRGTYTVKAGNRRLGPKHIDDADGFPRYYFDLDAMITEIACFLNKRKEGVRSYQTCSNSNADPVVHVVEETK